MQDDHNFLQDLIFYLSYIWHLCLLVMLQLNILYMSFYHLWL